jgi:hypothetical protein
MMHDIEESEKRQQQNQNNNQQQPKKPAVTGKIIDTWVADQDTKDVGISPLTLFHRTIENVTLKNGTSIILNGRRDGGENARYDYVDITPSAGGAPLHFEAENMKLSRYRVEKSPYASSGKDIILENNATGTARFEFPGVDGTYTLKVRYVDENDGKSTFTVSTQDPEPTASDDAAAPEAHTPPTAPTKPVATPAE